MKIKEIKDCNDISYLKNMLNLFKHNIYRNNLTDSEKKITDTTIKNVCKSIIKNKRILLSSERAFNIAKQQRLNLFDMNNDQMSAYYRGTSKELFAVFAYPIKYLLQEYLENKINENEFISKLYLIWVTKDESEILEKSTQWLENCKKSEISITCSKAITPLDMYEKLLDSEINKQDIEDIMLQLNFYICNK